MSTAVSPAVAPGRFGVEPAMRVPCMIDACLWVKHGRKWVNVSSIYLAVGGRVYSFEEDTQCNRPVW